MSNLDICKIVIVCPGQHHVKAQVWSFENLKENNKSKSQMNCIQRLEVEPSSGAFLDKTFVFIDI